MTTDLPEITLADVVLELRRIADAVAPPSPKICAEQRGDVECVLAELHVGHHVSPDGRLRWLDE